MLFIIYYLFILLYYYYYTIYQLQGSYVSKTVNQYLTNIYYHLVYTIYYLFILLLLYYYVLVGYNSVVLDSKPIFSGANFRSTLGGHKYFVQMCTTKKQAIILLQSPTFRILGSEQ